MADHNFFRILNKYPGSPILGLCYPLSGLSQMPISGSYSYSTGKGGAASFSHAFELDKNYSGFDASYITSSTAATYFDSVTSHNQIYDNSIYQYYNTLYYHFHVGDYYFGASNMTDNFRLEQFRLDYTGDGRSSGVSHLSSFYTSSEAIFNALGLTKSHPNNYIRSKFIRIDEGQGNFDTRTAARDYVYTTLTELDSQVSYGPRRSWIVQLKLTGSGTSQASNFNQGFVETIDINNTDTKAIEIDNNGDFCGILGFDIGYQYTSSLASENGVDFKKSIYILYHTASYAGGSGGDNVNTIHIEKLPVTSSIGSGGTPFGLLYNLPTMRQYSSSLQVNDWPSSFLMGGDGIVPFSTVPSWWVESFDGDTGGGDFENDWKNNGSPVNTNYIISQVGGYATYQLITFKDPSDGRTSNISNPVELYTCEKLPPHIPYLNQLFATNAGSFKSISKQPHLDNPGSATNTTAYYTIPFTDVQSGYQVDSTYTASFFRFTPSASYTYYNQT